jgi:CPA2 family monovalent cation:H+ antiporter-2
VSLPIAVRSYEHGNFEELIMLGADRVVPEMLEASLVISAQVLSLLGIPEEDGERQIQGERRAQLKQLRA